jgi:hypothetical protein
MQSGVVGGRVAEHAGQALEEGGEAGLLGEVGPASQVVDLDSRSAGLPGRERRFHHAGVVTGRPLPPISMSMFSMTSRAISS